MRKKIFVKVVAVYLSFTLLFEILFPTFAFALTGGPAQPESSSFAPVGTSDMVNLFSGDFNYNIPLMDVGGYPVNISYQSGISMDQEASWVGLGWNINPGAINRSMRGLPDDFNGDKVTKEFNVKPNQTYGMGLGLGLGFEVAGFEGFNLHVGLGVKYNNYTGVGFEQSINASLSAGQPGKTQGTASLGLKSSADGLDISPSVSASVVNHKKDQADTRIGASIGSSFNSRSGLKALSISTSMHQEGVGKDSEEHKSDGKIHQGSSSIGTGTSISMANNTYVPSISMPMKNISVNASFKAGPTAFSVDFSTDISGYYSSQSLAEKKQEIPAYGFLYSQNGQAMDKVLLDFNREKEGSFTKNTPSLPLTNFSYDIFSVSGQGVGGVFRPFRSDLGYVFDSRTSTTSDSYSLGVELGGGNLLKGGGDISITDVNSSSGKWVLDNTAAQMLRFKKSGENDLFEPVYFKEQGEKNVDSEISANIPSLYNTIGGSAPVRVELAGNGTSAHATGRLLGGEGEQATNNYTIHPLNSVNTQRTKRQRRNQLFSFITNEEYAASAVYKNLYFGNLEATPLDPIYKSIDPLTLASKNKKHIGEISTTKTDGSRYVYGIPAYNTYQKEVTFSMGGRSTTRSGGMIQYDPTFPDNSKNNHNGIDNYYSSTVMPAFAHSYLLTAVLSPDYVDLTGNGLSSDDYGTYTKFSYTKASATGNGIYNWRVPYQQNMANYNEGLRTEALDDQGNYIYGEKEIWVLNKIESKNYVAVFTTKNGNRADGYDVAGENGGLGDNTTPMLKKISLFSKPDYDLHNVAGTAVPIKEVHFVYNYSLCTAIPNNLLTAGGVSWVRDSECEEAINAGGKLTLKQIYFTYGKSFKAKLNPYNFSYSAFNPPYGLKDYDKWGNYKLDNAALPNSEFPYVEQNKTQADLYSSAWSLKEISLPSGGVITADYESDDYAYVQDRRAMQMFTITGIGAQGDNPKTMSPTIQKNLEGGDYLFFALQQSVPTGMSDATFIETYLKGIKDMYFRALVQVVPNVNPVAKEYVSGYATINLPGCGLSTTPGYGYIQLEKVKLDEKLISTMVNPISKAAVQFARINTSKKSYSQGSFPVPDDNPEKVYLGDVLNDLADASLVKNMVDAFNGPNGALYKDNVLGGRELGRDMQTDKSWVRLLNPNYKKLGGGSRVKKITISDEWASMGSGGQDFDYGQEYDYEEFENGKKILVNGQAISSGVASYEPMVGGDENPFRLPVAYTEKMKLAADLDYYKEEPFGETFFPSPSVGYSSVTVKNLQRPNVTLKRHATGSVVNEFYTTRDFPVITKRTPIDAKATTNVGQALKKLLKLDVQDYMTASQGFSIELNDMNGKPKATWVYAEDQAEYISGVEYKYKSSGNKLTNEATVMNKDGSISQTAQIGVDYDFVADMREQSTDILNVGEALQLYNILTPVPVLIPPILPIYTHEQTRFRSASVTKVISRFGLLDETIAYDLGSKVSTRNLAYDSETGDVILTKTKNDFNDEVFSLNYPAHLAYDRMGPGYKNVGAVVQQNTSTDGKITGVAANILVPGDEVQITPPPGNIEIGETRFWISKEGANLYAINRKGAHVSFGAVSNSVKVIRSGRRNQQSLSVGSFTSLANPVEPGNTHIPTFDQNYKVLTASASEFSEVWRNFCECGIDPADPNGPKNPYLLGLLGNWRPKKSYTFLSDRNQTKLNDNSNIRKDGTYTFFKPFWSPNLGSDWTYPADLYVGTVPNLYAEWTWTSEITEFSPFGPELENKDALNRYSSAIYGYNNTLPMAVASNAKYREIAFDGFEDYDFGTCRDDHFSFDLEPGATQGRGNYGHVIINGTVGVTEVTSHSGRRSINVKTGRISLTKNISDCPISPQTTVN